MSADTLARVRGILRWSHALSLGGLLNARKTAILRLEGEKGDAEGGLRQTMSFMELHLAAGLVLSVPRKRG